MKDSTALGQKAHATPRFYHPSDPFDKGAGWYLVDQAKHPDALRLLFEQDPAPVYDLPYIHSPHREQAFDGPLIIQPTTPESEKWLHGWLTEGKALALYGPQLTLEAIRNHLVSLNNVEAPYGESLFRYADPATLGSLGNSLSPHQCLRILGPLTAIHGHYGGKNWSLARDEAHATLNEPDDLYSHPLVLTKENLAAVELYRQSLLAKSIAANQGLDVGIVYTWFQQLIALEARNEQALVEGAGLLAKQGYNKELSENELAMIRKHRQEACWSDTLDAIAALAHSQEGP